MRERPTVVLTISRQLGSGGSYVGQAIANRFGMRYADREILKQAAAAAGLQEETSSPARKRPPASGTRCCARSRWALRRPRSCPRRFPPVYAADLFKLESLIIREIAETLRRGHRRPRRLPRAGGTAERGAHHGARGAGVSREARDGALPGP